MEKSEKKVKVFYLDMYEKLAVTKSNRTVQHLFPSLRSPTEKSNLLHLKHG